MSQCFTPSAPTNTTPIANQTICSNNSASLMASSSGTVSWFATPSSTTVLGTGTTYITPTLGVGTYTYYAEATTCTISASRTAITVTVNPSPTITVNSGAICSGNSFTMNASGANSYTYQGGNAIVSPTANTSYTVVGTNTLGCYSNIATSNITVNPLPTITANTSTNVLCVGSSATLTASGGSTYTWSPGGAGASIVVSPTVNSTYTVNGTDGIGCQNVTTITQSVTNCSSTAINSKLSNQSYNFQICPNPTNGKFTISGLIENASVIVFNSLGQMIVELESTADQTAIDLSSHSNGIYFIQITASQKKYTTKIIKN